MIDLSVTAMLRIGIGIWALLLSALVTGQYLSWASRQAIVDIPGPRSSHSQAKVTGGGVGIVAAVLFSLPLLSLVGILSPDMVIVVALSVGLALVGGIDDRIVLPVWCRLLFQVGACTALIMSIASPHYSMLCLALAALFLLWLVNLFNFMDGIDGIAASEVACIAIAAQFILPIHSTLTPLLIVTGAACIGFLLFNWPPARLFMGDTGSLFLGFLVGGITVSDSLANPVNAIPWLILWACFIADASLTLFIRLLRGRRIYKAHREHAYQRLARRWNSHLRVTSGLIFLNLIWLSPLALLAHQMPERAAWICALAYSPLLFLVWMTDRCDTRDLAIFPESG